MPIICSNPNQCNNQIINSDFNFVNNLSKYCFIRTLTISKFCRFPLIVPIQIIIIFRKNIVNYLMVKTTKNNPASDIKNWKSYGFVWLKLWNCFGSILARL